MTIITLSLYPIILMYSEEKFSTHL